MKKLLLLASIAMVGCIAPVHKPFIITKIIPSDDKKPLYKYEYVDSISNPHWFYDSVNTYKVGDTLK